MMFNKVFRYLGGDDALTIEYKVLWHDDEKIGLQKVREFNNERNRTVDPSDDNELDVFVEYPILYVINGFKRKEEWKILKIDNNIE